MRVNFLVTTTIPLYARIDIYENSFVSHSVLPLGPDPVIAVSFVGYQTITGFSGPTTFGKFTYTTTSVLLVNFHKVGSIRVQAQVLVIKQIPYYQFNLTRIGPLAVFPSTRTIPLPCADCLLLFGLGSFEYTSGAFSLQLTRTQSQFTSAITGAPTNIVYNVIHAVSIECQPGFFIEGLDNVCRACVGDCAQCARWGAVCECLECKECRAGLVLVGRGCGPCSLPAFYEEGFKTCQCLPGSLYSPQAKACQPCDYRPCLNCI
jgi:hypothetical protein